MKIVYEGITENSRPVVKTPVISATPFLLEYYQKFLNTYIERNNKVKTIKTPSMETNEKIPQYTDENFFSKIFGLCLPLIFFNPHSIIFMNTLMLVCKIQNVISISFVRCQFYKNGH